MPWGSATPVPLTEGVNQGQAVTWLNSHQSGRWADPAEPPRALPPLEEGSAHPLTTAIHQNTGSRKGRRERGVRPNSHFWQQPPTPTLKTKKGVKVLNIKLSRTPRLPTHLGGVPKPGTICGLQGVTWKFTPQQKPSPPLPKGQVPERLGRVAVPSRGVEVQPPPAIGDKDKCTWGSCQHLHPLPTQSCPPQWLPDPTSASTSCITIVTPRNTDKSFCPCRPPLTFDTGSHPSVHDSSL